MTTGSAYRYNHWFREDFLTHFGGPLRPQKKVLIFHYDRARRLCGRTRYINPARLPIFLSFLVFTLRLFGYKFRTVSDAMAEGYGKFACITFEGAYTDIARKVFPLLFRHNIPATLFVATGRVGRRRVVPQGIGPRRRTSGMSWAQIKDLVQKGWEVGTVGHFYTNLSERSQKDQFLHIQRAKDLIVLNLGVHPKVFAYPYGAYDASTLKYLREAGFTYSVTHKTGEVTSECLPLQLPRISLAASSFFNIAKLLRIIVKPIAADGQNLRAIASTTTATATVKAELTQIR